MTLLAFTQSIIAIDIISVSLDHSLLFLEVEKSIIHKFVRLVIT